MCNEILDIILEICDDFRVCVELERVWWKGRGTARDIVACPAKKGEFSTMVVILANQNDSEIKDQKVCCDRLTKLSISGAYILNPCCRAWKIAQSIGSKAASLKTPREGSKLNGFPTLIPNV